MQLPRISAVAAERSGQRAVVAVEDPHHVVRAIGHKDVALLWIG